MALQEVVVISHHVHAHTDKHHGIEYVFEPNKKVQVPLAAAVHFFGIGLPENAPARQMAWKRCGFTSVEKGEAYLKKFEVKVVDLVPAGSDIEEFKTEQAKTLNTMKASHETTLAELEAEHREEIQRINKEHDEETAQLKARIAELEATPGPKKTK